jgi:hypothetical protein
MMLFLRCRLFELSEKSSVLKEYEQEGERDKEKRRRKEQEQ